MNYVYCWKFKEDYLSEEYVDDVDLITDFNMSDPYIFDTYSCYEIIVVFRADKGIHWYPLSGTQYVIDNTLRS